MTRRTKWLLCVALSACLLPSPAAALKELGTGDRVADVRLLDADENAVRLSELVPAKGAVVVFWAAWNPRSPEVLGYLGELHERYAAQGLTVLPVNVEHEGTGPEDRRSYGSTYAGWGLPWPTYFDPKLEAFDAVGVISLPTTVYLAQDLKILGAYPGFPGEAQDALPLLVEKGLGIWEPEVAVRKPVAVGYEPANGAGAQFQMGRLLYRRGQRGKASAYFSKAAGLDPSYPEPRAALAYLAHLGGDGQAAAGALEALEKAGADNTRFREAYGLSLLATGRREAAAAALEPLLDEEEPHLKGLLGLALAHAMEGDLPAAGGVLQRLRSWPIGGLSLEIDVSAYVDPDAPPDRRWSDPDAVLLWLLELK